MPKPALCVPPFNIKVKGDFDGAIDVYVETGRVRMVRAEMEIATLSNGGCNHMQQRL